MRMRRSRIERFYWRKRISVKDKEGSSYETWGAAVPFCGECWPASGKVQAEQYGERLPYIRNLRINGKYAIRTDESGITFYDFGGGLEIRESDGICLHANSDQDPDYRIISIRPYIFLKLEVERI